MLFINKFNKSYSIKIINKQQNQKMSLIRFVVFNAN